jgi:F-type H+-transporting ATPase subunit epsilon
MHIEILTPDETIFSGEAKSMKLPALDGSLGVLENHAPMITSLKKGVIILRDEKGNEEKIEVAGGTVEVLRNKVIVLAE